MQQETKREKWGEKPYFSLDYYLKETFGEKVYKIALDAGMTCPNRDGTLDTRGCIFCSNGGSGDFATHCITSVTEQINQAIAFIHSHHKKTGNKYIAYFQSFSNTYAPVQKLQQIFSEALAHPQIVGLSIATRPDCFSPEIYDVLEQCNRKKPVWIELGLQTIHEKTAAFIRRGYPLATFEEAVRELRKRNLSVITHIILGLPGESNEEILQTVRYLNGCDIQGVKFQLLHILKGTDLARLLPELTVYTQEEYIALLLQCIGTLSPDIVIHRLTGDGPKDLLLAPLWSLNKRNVLNQIAQQLKKQHIYQGKFYTKPK
ncbi:MAG: TIGR01212 family radical SAM protein [Butyribacter sp.]|nr:TIGR01212 family radical SAM protein [bacterium]MDY3855442.1 TIGR01212 family radical SAM protein [Butyribacter sp.]